MRILLAVFLLVPLHVFSSSSVQQHRLPNESFRDAVKRAESTLPKHMIHAADSRQTPLRHKVPLHKIDVSLAPVMSSYEEMIMLFNLIRDSRFLYTKDNSAFPRRISWLYPDDGCFARAAMSGMKLQDEHLVRPAKVFVFGDLTVQTPYSITGVVSWWYHVSIVVNYGGAIYVLDPAMNSAGPLLLEDWFNKMGFAENIEGVICNPYTYDPFDDCFTAHKDSDRFALSHQNEYLLKEWERIGILGFNPVDLLDSNPPWIVHMKSKL